MIFGLPLAFILMLLIWRILIIAFPSEGGQIRFESRKFGSLNAHERNAILVLLAVAALSVASPFIGLDEYAVALVGAVFFFSKRLHNMEAGPEEC